MVLRNYLPTLLTSTLFSSSHLRNMGRKAGAPITFLPAYTFYDFVISITTTTKHKNQENRKQTKPKPL